MQFSAIFLFFVCFILFSVPQAFAEGGGGVDCPASSNGFSYQTGTAIYQEMNFESGSIGVLFCDYDNDGTYGQIIAVLHVTGDLSDELIAEYGCGARLGEEFGPVYLSGTTHFAAVVYTENELEDGASQVLSQIENQNLATICSDPEPDLPPKPEPKTIPEDTPIKTPESIIEPEISEPEISEPEISEPEISEETVSSEEIALPNWIKNNAEWWSGDLITDNDFAKGIEYMINNGIINIPPTEVASETSDEIPNWVKNNAEWWSEDLISDDEFVNGLQYLVSNGIISVT